MEEKEIIEWVGGAHSEQGAMIIRGDAIYSGSVQTHACKTE